MNIQSVNNTIDNIFSFYLQYKYTNNEAKGEIMNKNENNTLIRENIKVLQEHSSWYLFLGIGLIALGTLAITYAFTATVISVLYFGTLLIFVGFFETSQALSVENWENFISHTLLAVMYLISGFYIILNPYKGILTATLFLSIVLIVSGLIKMIASITSHIARKGWVFTNGLLKCILGLLIWYQLPQGALWIIGMIIGIDMLFSGWSWIFLVLQARKAHIQKDNE
jgi:uncharacterized membrane protein HdeD (DUF308 family)